MCFNYLKIAVFNSKQFSTSAIASGKLDGKVAIVTASTFGIGLAIAKKMALDGAKVMISSRKDKHVEKALDGLYKMGISKSQIAGIVCHVADKAQRAELIKRTAEQFGGIDILVNNAAVNPHVGKALECPESKWDKVFEVNVKAPYMLSQDVYPYFQKRKGGSIIFISSIAGFFGFPEISAYSVSKTALFGLTKVLANALGPENIRVNCVAPGIIRTKFSAGMLTNMKADSVIFEKHIPLRRQGEPDEIAGIVSLLASDEGSYITGENIVVGGGVPSRL